MNTASDQMEKISEGLKQACDDMSTNCSRSVGVFVEATAAMSKGYEEFNRKLGSLIQESLARAMNTGKFMMSVRSIEEAGKLQAECAKDLFDQWVSGTGQLTEISARTTRETFEPVAQHANDAMSKAVQKAQTSRAA